MRLRDRMQHETHEEQYIERLLAIYCDAISTKREAILVPNNHQEQCDRMTLIGMLAEQVDHDVLARYFKTDRKRVKFYYHSIIEERVKFMNKDI